MGVVAVHAVPYDVPTAPNTPLMRGRSRSQSAMGASL